MTTLLLELPDELVSDLHALATREGKTVDRYAVNALLAHAQRQAITEEVSAPPFIAEGSPEEDAALDAALAGSFHAFDAETAHRKMLLLRR